MRVLFLTNPGPRDTPRGEHYEAGKVYDLTPDRAYKWTKVLGIAVEVPPVAVSDQETDSPVDDETPLGSQGRAGVTPPAHPGA
jgi:hypothetical protein